MDIDFKCVCGQHVSRTLPYIFPLTYISENGKEHETLREIHCERCRCPYKVRILNTFQNVSCCINNGAIQATYSLPYDPAEEYVELGWSLENVNHFEIFKNHLKSVRALLEIDVKNEIEFSLLVMIYGHIVSAIEGFIEQTFIYEVTNSEILVRKLVETDPEFSNRRISIKEIFGEHESIKITVANYLKGLIFHDLKKVKPMYKSVLGIDFGNIAWLFSAVLIRHDCVHRAGYTREGKKIEVSREILLELLTRAESLAAEVVRDIYHLKSKI